MYVCFILVISSIYIYIKKILNTQIQTLYYCIIYNIIKMTYILTVSNLTIVKKLYKVVVGTAQNFIISVM